MVRPACVIAVLGGMAVGSPVDLPIKSQEAEGKGTEVPELALPDVILNKDEEDFCGHKFIKTPQDGNGILDDTHAVWEIDDWIAKNGAENWLSRYTKEKFGKELDAVSDIGDCVHRGGTCEPGVKGWKCVDYYRYSEKHQSRVAFWVYTLVTRIHSKLDQLGKTLTEGALDSLMGMANFDVDWDGEQDGGKNAWDWIKLALGFGGIFAGRVPGVGDALDIAQTVAEGAHELATHEYSQGGKTEKVDSKKITGMLKEYYTAARSGIDEQLAVGFGAMSMPKDVDPQLVLPRGRIDGNPALRTDIGKWLNNGFWLVDADQAPTMRSFLSGVTDISRKFVDMKLKEKKYVLTADGNHDEAACRKGGADGWEWLEHQGKWWCFHIMQRAGPAGGFAEEAHTQGQEFYNKMNKYGFKIGNTKYYAKYYKHLLKCDEAWGVANNNTQGGLVTPTCYYSMPVLEYRPRSSPVCDNGFVKKCRHFDMVDMPKSLPEIKLPAPLPGFPGSVSVVTTG